MPQSSPAPDLNILHAAQGSGRGDIGEIAGHQCLQHMAGWNEWSRGWSAAQASCRGAGQRRGPGGGGLDERTGLGVLETATVMLASRLKMFMALAAAGTLTTPVASSLSDVHVMLPSTSVTNAVRSCSSSRWSQDAMFA